MDARGYRDEPESVAYVDVMKTWTLRLMILFVRSYLLFVCVFLFNIKGMMGQLEAICHFFSAPFLFHDTLGVFFFDFAFQQSWIFGGSFLSLCFLGNGSWKVLVCLLFWGLHSTSLGLFTLGGISAGI